MDSELHQALAQFEGRLHMSIDEVESRINARIDHAVAQLEDRLNARIDSVETGLRTHIEERIEATETKLLSAFHNWAQTFEVRARGTSRRGAGVRRTLGADRRAPRKDRAVKKSAVHSKPPRRFAWHPFQFSTYLYSCWRIAHSIICSDSRASLETSLRFTEFHKWASPSKRHASEPTQRR